MRIECKKQIADAINKVAAAREESWDREERRYTITISEASSIICRNDPALASLVNLLLLACWNDALDWSKENV